MVVNWAVSQWQQTLSHYPHLQSYSILDVFYHCTVNFSIYELLIYENYHLFVRIKIQIFIFFYVIFLMKAQANVKNGCYYLCIQTSKRAEHVRMPTIPGGDGEPELPAPESGSLLQAFLHNRYILKDYFRILCGTLYNL